jgi:hypothetical protein
MYAIFLVSEPSQNRTHASAWPFIPGEETWPCFQTSVEKHGAWVATSAWYVAALARAPGYAQLQASDAIV